jgi:hypothetical protein
MGGLNIASLGFAIGAMGQYWFYGRFFPHLSHWIVGVVLCLPWLTIYTISFCNAAPFGPRPFRLCLIGAMVWYVLTCIFAEITQHFVRLPPDGHFTVTAARVLMYFGVLSFVVFIRACISLNRYEKSKGADHPHKPAAEES